VDTTRTLFPCARWRVSGEIVGINWGGGALLGGL
jgi:hypothetical protein